MGLDWYPMDSYSPGDGDAEQYWPEPWVGPKGQHKCGACGRFLTKGGTCSLVQMTYREGSPYGYEHR